MKTALVTGDAGFVGRHMVIELLRRGYHVTGVDIDMVGIDPEIHRGPYLHVTMDCRKFFTGSIEQYDLVIHLAAVIGGRAQIEGNPLSLAVDLELDAAMFQWAVRTKQPRVVYYSSSAAYPTHVQNGLPPLKSVESMVEIGRKGLKNIGVPDMSYGWVKLTGEYLATLAEEQGVRVHVFRPFSGYGYTQSLDYPFPSFIRRALDREDPFTIWGNGLQVRDWIHIDDVVEGTLTCVEADVKGPVNLCTGQPTSFVELAKLVTGLAGYDANLYTQTSKPSGVMYRVGDPGKMLKYYTPKIELSVGILDALKWMKDK